MISQSPEMGTGAREPLRETLEALAYAHQSEEMLLARAHAAEDLIEELREALAELDRELLFDEPVTGTAKAAFAKARAALSKAKGEA